MTSKHFKTVLAIKLTFALSACSTTIDITSPKLETHSSKAPSSNVLSRENTYVTYKVEVENSEGNEIVGCNNSEGNPIVDLEESYSLHLSPNINNESKLWRTAVLYRKENNNCIVDKKDLLLGPYMRVPTSEQKISFKFEQNIDMKIDKGLLDSSFTTISLFTNPATLIALQNPATIKALEDSVEKFDDKLTGLTHGNKHVQDTSDIASLTDEQIRQTIYFHILEDGDINKKLGKVIVRPVTIKTIFKSSDNQPKEDYVTIDEVSPDLSGFMRYKGQTYGDLLGDQGSTATSLKAIRSINFNTSNPSLSDIDDLNASLLDICKNTRAILEKDGLHDYDWHLLTAQRLEESTLWKSRLKELNYKQKYTNDKSITPSEGKEIIDQLETIKNDLEAKKAIDLSKCLDYDILRKQGISIVTSKEVESNIESIKKDIKEINDSLYNQTTLINYFLNDFGSGTLNVLEPDGKGKSIRREKKEYVIKANDNLLIDSKATITYKNYDYSSTYNERKTISIREALEDIYENDIWFSGCPIPHKNMLSPGQYQIEGNTIDLLYTTHNKSDRDNVGILTFKYEAKDGHRILTAITNKTLSSDNIGENHLDRIRSSGWFKEGQHCYKNVLNQAEKYLAAR